MGMKETWLQRNWFALVSYSLLTFLVLVFTWLLTLCILFATADW